MNWMVFGHRGAAAYAPENTLAAINRGLALGADGIEIDVQLTGDNVLAVYHDESVADVGAIAQTPWAQLSQVDVGQGERIPTLDQVLDEMAARGVLNIEIKSEKTADRVVDCVQRHLAGGVWQPSRLLVSSFHHRELYRVRTLAPDLPLGVLSETGETAHLDYGVKLAATAAHVDYRAVTPELLTVVRERGLRLYVYTVNRVQDLRLMAQLGVDGVISDYPDRARELG